LHYGRLLRRLFGLALRRPGLVLPLLGAAWRFRARGWYRQPPFLPLPPAEYVAWRLHTAYGDEDAVPPVRELARYVRWSDRFGRGGPERLKSAPRPGRARGDLAATDRQEP
jgi:hypothetical protein